MREHTPGPWRIVPQRGTYEGNYNVGREADRGRVLLTFVCVLGPNDIVPLEYAAAAEANARLIAAAPDLLAACEAFVESWEKSHQLEKTDAALRMAKSAIAKAKGEADA